MERGFYPADISTGIKHMPHATWSSYGELHANKRKIQYVVEVGKILVPDILFKPEHVQQCLNDSDKIKS